MAPSPRPPAPVQAIVGEDSYLAEAALERVLHAAVGQDRSEAVQVVYGDEQKGPDGGWERVLARARTGSLFASRRAIVVRRADMFPEDRGTESESETPDAANDTKGGGKKKKAEEHPLIRYVADPSPEVALVLVASRPDRRRSPWAKLLKKDASVLEVHEVAPPKGRALRMHVEQELRRRGLRFASDGLEDLLSEVGQDLRRLMGEVDKLESYAAGRKDISAEDVAAVIGRPLERPFYLLSDAFAVRDVGRSLELLESFLADKAREEKLKAALISIATLHRTLRQVRGAIALREAGVAKPQIGARLLPPNMQFKLEALLTAARRWSEADIQKALLVLEQTDRAIKRGADASVALTGAVAAACGGTAAASSPTSRRRAT